MLRVHYVALVVFVPCFACGKHVEAAPVHGLPRQGLPRVEELAHDFGVVRPGGAVETLLRLTNPSTVPLVPTVTVDCGCIRIGPIVKPTPAGEECALHVTFDPTSRQGPQKQLVRVQWGASASTHVTVTGNVLAEVSVEPPAGFSARVGRGAMEFVASCTATFGYAEPPVAVELAELSVFQDLAEPPAVRLEWPWSADSNAVKVSMTGNVMPAFECLGGCVRLRAKWAERTRDVTIPFHVERRPMMVVSPRVLYVGKELDAATVRVLASDSTLIDGLNVVASGSGGSTLLPAPKKGGTFVFDGRILHEARADSIWISTSAGDLQQVPIVLTER